MWCILAFIFSNLFSLFFAFMYGQLKGIESTNKYYEKKKEELKPIDVTKYNVTENGNVVVKEELTEAKELLRELLDNRPDTYSGTDVELNQKKMFAFQRAVMQAETILKEEQNEK